VAATALRHGRRVETHVVLALTIPEPVNRYGLARGREAIAASPWCSAMARLGGRLVPPDPGSSLRRETIPFEGSCYTEVGISGLFTQPTSLEIQRAMERTNLSASDWVPFDLKRWVSMDVLRVYSLLFFLPSTTWHGK
jgi:hypothetical protein